MVLMVTCFLLSAGGSYGQAPTPPDGDTASEVHVYQKAFKRANRAYLDGQYDLAVRYLAQCIEMNPQESKAFRLLKVVLDEKAKFVGSKSYQEFIQQLGAPESEKVEKFQAQIKKFVEFLSLEMGEKVEEISRGNEDRFEGLRTALKAEIDRDLAAQRELTQRQDERLRRMGLLLGMGALVCGVFILMALYLLVTVFRLGSRLEQPSTQSPEPQQEKDIEPDTDLGLQDQSKEV